MSDQNLRLIEELERAIIKREAIIARAGQFALIKPPLAARLANSIIDYAKRALAGQPPTNPSIALKALEDFNRGRDE